MSNIERIQLTKLIPNRNNARTHSKKQIAQIAESIKAFGFLVPILTDENRNILAGHGRHAAAQLLKLESVPTISVQGLSDAKKRALALADNKLAENAGWDREILASELSELSEILMTDDLDIAITGFAAVEIDQLMVDLEEVSTEPADTIDSSWLDKPQVSKAGDVWELGNHRVCCGDARENGTLERLLEGERAAMAFLDPPYNVEVRGVVGRGKIKHDEFAMASGEMSRGEFVEFLTHSLQAASRVSAEGAVHFVCIDWRHVSELIEAGNNTYSEMLNLAVWVKSNIGQGSFYRSQHELIGVFKVGDGPFLNNIEQGRHGRCRSNVWQYAGANTFRAGRLDDLKSHPTVKPIALVADALRDCTRRGDLVLDTFCGSGTTILAAERVARRAYTVEIEPKYVDVAIRRWQAFARRDAINLDNGRSFDETFDVAVASRGDVR